MTNLGPFVSQEASKERIKQVVLESADELDIDLEEMEEEEREELVAEVAQNMYSGDSQITEAKRVRLEHCLKRKWAINWLEGMEGGLNFELTGLERVVQQITACMALVDNATTDNPEALPDDLT